MRRATLCGMLAALCAATSAEAASFGCTASAGRITVLGQAVEPIRANVPGTVCAGETKTLGPATGLPSPVTATALVAGTEVFPEQKSVLASGGVAELRVLSLPTLPIALPTAAVSDAARAAIAAARSRSIDLDGVAGLIPVLDTSLVTNLVTTLTADVPVDLPEAIASVPEVLVVVVGPGFSLPTDLPTDLREDLPINLPTTFALDAADPALDTLAEVNAANAANAAANAANAAANAANAAANLANDAANTVNAELNAFGAITLGNVAAVTLKAAEAEIENIAANAANLLAETNNITANAANTAANASNAAINAVHAATNAANLIINAANAAQNAVRAAILALPPISIDGAAGLDALLAGLLPAVQLPTAELLRVRGAMAYAAGSCEGGTPGVTGSSAVTGISVLGQDVPVGQVVDRLLTLIDTANIDPSQVALPAIDLGLTQAQLDLINAVPAAKAALDAAVDAARAAIQAALDGLAAVKVLDPTLAQVKVTPGTQVKSGGAITQQALTVAITIAGQQLVEAVIGEARAASAGVDCDDAVVDPNDVAGATGGVGGTGAGSFSAPSLTPTGATLQCTTRRLVLVDVLERNGRVKLFGVADGALVGRTVAIVFNATGDTVAHAKVARDGTFETTAPLPPRALRESNDARYMATLGDEESTNLKLRRRMLIDTMDSRNGKVTITGRVVRPLARPLAPITLTRRTSCTREVVEKRFKPRADGTFRVTVDAPRRAGTAVYRLTTRVRFSTDGSGVFKTYTLPRAVDLDR
jgi:hypothetical protein